MVGQRKKPAGSWDSPGAALDLSYTHVWQPDRELLESALLSLDRGPSTSEGSLFAGNCRGPAPGDVHAWKGPSVVLEKQETGQKIMNWSSGVSFATG